MKICSADKHMNGTVNISTCNFCCVAITPENVEYVITEHKVRSFIPKLQAYKYGINSSSFHTKYVMPVKDITQREKK